MTMIRRTTPFMQFGSLRQAVDQMFDDSAFRPLARAYSAPRNLPVDITANEDAVTIEAALPGVRPEDVELSVHEDALTISVKSAADTQTDDGERVYREVRRSHGSRTLHLPKGLDVDGAVATFENGLLQLSIPRAAQAKPRQIALSPVSEATHAEPQALEGETGAETAEQA